MKLKLADYSALAIIEPNLTLAIKLMNQSGNFQWNQNYPTIKCFAQDIEQQDLYVLVNNQQDEVGYCSLVSGYHTEYYQQPHHFIYPNPSSKLLYIHRVLINQHYLHQAMGTQLLKQVIKQFISEYDAILVDTNVSNIPMQGAIKRAGFIQRGQFSRTYVKTPWVCYEITKEDLVGEKNGVSINP